MLIQQPENHGVNPDLGNLLTAMHMGQFASELVKIECVDLDDFAVRLVMEDISLAIIPHEQRERLRSRLELRGVLGASGLEIGSPLVALTEFAPTCGVLQAHPWSLIQEKLGQADRDQVDVVRRLWEQGSHLRMQIREAGLDSIIADQIEERIRALGAAAGIPQQEIEACVRADHALDFLSRAAQEEIINLQADTFSKAQVRSFFRKHLTYETEEAHRRAAEIEVMRDQQQKALELLQSLKADISASENATSASTPTVSESVTVASRLSVIAETLGIPPWTFGPSELFDVQAESSLIGHLEHAVKQFGEDLAEARAYDSDEDVIALASSSAALRGIYLGVRGPQGHLIGRRTTNPILAKPVYCPLRNLETTPDIRTEIFECKEDGDGFCTLAEGTGLSIATSLKSCGYDFVSGRPNTKSSTEGRLGLTSTSASVLKYHYCPMASFSVPRAEMRLSVEAHQDAMNIITCSEAHQFLLDYGAFVPGGIHHLGGILWYSVVVESSSTVSFSVLQSTATQEINSTTNLDRGSQSVRLENTECRIHRGRSPVDLPL